MDCNGECSNCSDVVNCTWFFDNFILPDIIKEQEEEEYHREIQEKEKQRMARIKVG